MGGGRGSMMRRACENLDIGSRRVDTNTDRRKSTGAMFPRLTRWLLGGGQMIAPFFVAKHARTGLFAEMVKTVPDYTFEHGAALRGCVYISGTDEVGRGPLAGPVTAAAVRLDPDNIPAGLNDSKVLTSKRREVLAIEIWAVADVCVAHASVEEIDDINILQASMLAMERAVAGLPQSCDHVLVDGNRVPKGLQDIGEAIVKGDGRSVSIAAASIVAKTCRDQIMVDLAQQHPGYGWERNAGYGTSEHLKALQILGVTPHHRRSFKPIHNILYQDKNVSD